MTAISGGKFWSGFAAGALSSIVSSVWNGGSTVETKFETNSSLTEGHFVTNTFSHQGIGGALGANNTIGMIAFGTVSGGAGAALTGGNFWQGAASGLMVSGLNHAMHAMMEVDIDGPIKGKSKSKTNKSDLKSASAIVGYEGMVLNKAELLVTYATKGQSFSNLRHVSKTLKLTGKVGKGLGIAGIGLTVFEDYNSGGVSWGTVAKVGIGTAFLFASAPVSLTYAALDIGVGLATGTTITDRVGNYVNEKMK